MAFLLHECVFSIKLTLSNTQGLYFNIQGILPSSGFTYPSTVTQAQDLP